MKRYLPRDHGEYTDLSWLDMEFSRDSVAWCPTGEWCGVDIPRFDSDVLLSPRFNVPKLYSFPSTTGYTAYDDIYRDPCYYPAETTQTFRDLVTELERATKHVHLEPILLSYSWEGRAIYGYRLGSCDKKHFVVTCAVHGNEVDGLPGSFKGIELLCTHDAFAAFRDEWTIFFVPAINPDGIVHFNRLTRQLQLSTDGVNYVGINCNRVFDWFWADYNPSASESKGAYPEQPGEVAGLLKYWRTGCRGHYADFKFLLDMHSTAGDGSRYQSRDRCWRDQDAYDWLYTYADQLLHKTQLSAQRRRIEEDGDPELYIRYYRSRKRPHLHPYFSTRPSPLNCVSIVTEENKIQAARAELARTETYAGACNYRMDYILSAAMVMTTGSCQKRSAVYVEGLPATNLLNNSGFDQWQPDELRPGWTRLGRARIARKRRDRVHDYHGAAVEYEAAISIELPSAAAYISMCLSSVTDNASLALLREGTVDLIDISQTYGSFKLSPAVISLTTHDGLRGAIASPGAAEDSIVLIGGVKSDGSHTTLVTEVSALSGTPSETAKTTRPSGIAYAGYCDNSLAVTSHADVRTYYAGGQTTSNVSTAQSGAVVYDPNTDTYTSTTMPFALTQCGCAYVHAGDHTGKAYIIGGITTGGTYHLGVLEWDISSFSVTSVSGLVVPASYIGLESPSLCYDEVLDRVMVFCGKRSDGTLSTVVYAYTPGSTELVETSVNNSVDDVEIGEYSGPALWSTQIVGAAMAPYMSDEGVSMALLVGGEDASSQLLATVYMYDPFDNLIGDPSQVSYGYLRYSSRIEADTEETILDSCVSGEDSYTILAGSVSYPSDGELTVNAGTTLRWQPSYSGKGATSVFRATIAWGTTADFSLRMRYDSSTTYHYRIEWQESVSTLSIIRHDASGDTTLRSLALVGPLSEATWRFYVAGTDPVRISISYEIGLTATPALYVDDFSTSRLTADGEIRWTAVNQMTFKDEIGVGDSLANTGGIAATAVARSAEANTSGYNRLTFNVKDDAVDCRDITRRVRNYYTTAPIKGTHEYRASIDLSSGYTSRLEDGGRLYMRTYTDGQPLVLENWMLTAGKRPMTWHPAEEGTRAIESAKWTAAVSDPNNFYVELEWLPIGDFGTLDEDMVIAQLDCSTEDWHFLLVAPKPHTSRMYNLNDSYADHDPVLRLEKWQNDSTLLQSVEVICYWGMNNVRDVSHERYDISLRVSLIHVGGQYLELRIEKAGAEGSNYAHDSTLTHLPYGQTDLSLLDGGLFASPRIRSTVLETDGVVRSPFNISRRLRLQHDLIGAVLPGERDPSNGYVDWRALFYVPETFERADDSNLGSHWDIMIQSGNGWDIESNKAKCTTYGLERWDSNPGLLNMSVDASFAADDVGSKIGLLLHLDSSDAYYGRIYCYSVEMEPASASAATMRIVRWWHDSLTGLNSKTTLVSTTINYIPGSFVSASIQYDSNSSNNLIAIVDGNTLSISDEFIQSPGKVGIYGETAGSSEAVWIDSISVSTSESISLND
jgi:hypothetical protein